jgi:hypothetical protein
MTHLHEVGVGLFIFFSVLSLTLVVSKPVAKELETTALTRIRAYKRIQAEWKAPLIIEQSSQSPPLMDETRSEREPV